MVGEEYKFARKMLTKKLEGNSAWQKMMEPTEIESKEVCNQAQSEEEMMDNHCLLYTSRCVKETDINSVDERCQVKNGIFLD